MEGLNQRRYFLFSIYLYLAVQHFEIDTPKELSSQIRNFWYRDMDFGPSAAALEVLPDGNAEIIFYFSSSCKLILDQQVQDLSSPFVVGLLKGPVHFESVNRLQIIGIKCRPWAVYDLLNIPSATGGVQSINHPLALLQLTLEQLLLVGKVTEALETLRDWFLINHTPEVRPGVLTKAGKVLLETSGSLPVSAVASAAHATVRTLERKFKASSGHTVKDVAGLIRFEEARDYLYDHPDVSVSALAHKLGYSDQSHLNREFKRYSGLTAAAFAKQMLMRKREHGSDFVAIILSP
jgi:AraC-like DNA-binding protein